MRVLIVGSGAREHALAEVLVADGADVYAAGPWRNPGIASLAREYAVLPLNAVSDLVAFACGRGVELVIPGGEDALAAGVVDEAVSAGVRAMGPGRAQAQLESSKGYARALLDRYQLAGNPFYRVVEDDVELRRALRQLSGRYVLKADGLRGGKGVKLAGEHLRDENEAVAFGEELLATDACLVVEELLQGQEFSLFTLADGSACVHAPLVQDHKRAFEGDKGPNTGGMGSYAMADGGMPFVSDHEVDAAWRLNERVLEVVATEHGTPFRGVLYGSFIATADGIRLIEYNVRFGDPEVMNLVGLAQVDWLQLCDAISRDALGNVRFDWKSLYSVCRYLVPQGYPDAPLKGALFPWPKTSENVRCYLGSVVENGDQLQLQGSRALALVAESESSLAEACARVDRACRQVEGPLFYRSDIGEEGSVRRKVAKMDRLREPYV